MTDTPSIKHPGWLRSGDFTEADEPFALFDAWFEDAKAKEPADPNAMALATVDGDGLPDVRMVLLKGFDATRLRVLHEYRPARKGANLPPSPRRRCCSTGNR